MTKKDTLLVAVLLVLVAGYAIFFTDWFKPRTIRIFDTMRPIRHFRARHDLPYILFGLEGSYRLTEVKVVSLNDFQKDPGAPPLWHLVSDSNSAPVKEFVYGQHIRGMKPAIKGENPEDIQTNVVYRLLVAAGSVKGQKDFEIK